MPSRQYLWQVKQQAKGNCIICGKPRAQYRFRCDVCTAKQRTLARERRNQTAVLTPREGLASSYASTGVSLTNGS
jgi:hypothetical protein